MHRPDLMIRELKHRHHHYFTDSITVGTFNCMDNLIIFIAHESQVDGRDAENMKSTAVGTFYIII